MHNAARATAPVVVVGTGPVGIHSAAELLKRKPATPILIYGNEPWEPNNRVRLAGLLTGELDFAGIQNPLQLPLGHQVVQHHNCAIVAIDLPGRRVRDQLGNWRPYSRLVLATGSAAPLISPPSIPTSVSRLSAFPVTTATRTRPGATSSWAAWLSVSRWKADSRGQSTLTISDTEATIMTPEQVQLIKT
ncbi:MAG: hypothetical protein WAL92_09145, partial [Thiogranum sp.]